MDLFKWAKIDETKKIADKTKDKAWNDFKSKYPNANITKFKVQIEINGINDVTAEVFFKVGPGYLKSVLG